MQLISHEPNDKQPNLMESIAPKQQVGRPRKNSDLAVRPSPQPIFKEPVKESKYVEFLLREKYRLYEDQERLAERRNAINFLEKTAREWAVSLAKSKGMTETEEMAREHAKVTEFGSFFLDVHFPHTDIDAICVFRKQCVERKEFHDQFVKLLEKMPEFSNVHLIQQAKVPIIKFVLKDFHFDVLFAAIEDVKRLPSLLKKVACQGLNDEFNRLSENTQSSLQGKIVC